MEHNPGHRRYLLALFFASAAVAALTNVVPTVVSIVLAALAAIFYFWAKSRAATEAAILRLPGGQYLLGILRWIDTVGVQPDHDEGLERRITDTVAAYSLDQRVALRRLLRERNPKTIPDKIWEQFNRDSLVEHPFSGPGVVKSDLAETVDRALDRALRHSLNAVRTDGSKLLAIGRRANREAKIELERAKEQWEGEVRSVLALEGTDPTFLDRFNHGPVEQIGTFVGPNRRLLNDLNSKLLRLEAMLKELADK